MGVCRSKLVLMFLPSALSKFARPFYRIFTAVGYSFMFIVEGMKGIIRKIIFSLCPAYCGAF